MTREDLYRMLDLVEAGDVAAAVNMMLDAVEGEEPEALPFVCSCGRRFRWPGALDGHLRRYGHQQAEAA